MNSTETNMTETSAEQPTYERHSPTLKDVLGRAVIFDRKATLHLIECVRNRPKLWQRQFIRKRLSSCQSEWEDIQRYEFPSYTVVQLKARWKTMRDSFRRETKRIECGELSQSRWTLYKDMLFLDGHFRHKKNVPSKAPASFAKRKVNATRSKESIAVKPLQEVANDRFKNRVPVKESAHSNEHEHERSATRTTIVDVNDAPVGISEVTYSNKFRTRIISGIVSESTQAGQGTLEQDMNNRQFLMTLVPFLNMLAMDANLELRLKMLQLVASATQIVNGSQKR